MPSPTTSTTSAMPIAQQAIDHADILEHIGDAVVVVDAQHRVLLWNRAAAALFGWTAAEALGRPTTELVRLGSVEGASRAAILQALQEQGSWAGETLIVGRDSVERLIEGHVRAIRDASGTVTHIVALVGDVAARAEARAAQARLQVLAEASRRFAAATLDLDTLLRTITDYLAATVGDLCLLRVPSADREQMVAVQVAHPNPEARQLAAALLQTTQPVANNPVGTVLLTGVPLLVPVVPQDRLRAVTVPHHMPYLDQFGIHSLLMVPILLHGAAIGVLSLSRDTPGRPFTPDDQAMCQEIADRAALAIDHARAYADEQRARQEAEAALATKAEALALLDTLFAAAPIGLAYVTPDMRFVRINAALAGLNGLPVADHLGRTLAEVLPDLTPALEPIYRSVLATGEPVVGQEISGETPAAPGEQRHWLASYYPVPHPDGSTQGVGVVVSEITERRRVEKQLRVAAEAQRNFTRRLVDVQEAERGHLARELHDEVGQLLTGFNMLLESAVRGNAAARVAHLAEAQATLRELIAQVRRMSIDLRPPMLDDLGLLTTLRWHIERYQAQTRILVRFQHRGLERPLAPPAAITAYRIVQEALTNVARHARVSVVDVQLWIANDTLSVQVQDTGCGFDVAAQAAQHNSRGLAGMHERARLLGGSWELLAAPGEGTQILAILPLSVPDSEEETLR